ncbi:MAG: PDZ domain-containing protein [Bdellovibrionota bacterium]
MVAVFLCPRVESAEPSTVAEIRFYDNLLDLMEVSTHETTPYWDDNAHINPNVYLTAKPQILDSNNTMQVRLGMSLSGNALGSGSQWVTRKKWSGADVQSEISGYLYKDLHLTPTEIVSSSLRGNPNVNFWVSQTYNNFGLLSGLVHRKTAKKAASDTAAKLPQKNAKMKAQIDSAANAAVSRANGVLREQLHQVEELVDGTVDLPYQTRFSSRAASTELRGRLQAKFTADDRKDRGTLPGMDNPYQPASAFFLHEDAIEDAISPQLAGKELRLSEVHKILCRQSFSKALDFCNKEMDDQTRDTGILFDKDNPFDISFENNQIRVQLHAVHHLHNKNSKAEGVLNDPPAAADLSFQGSPYTIEVLYDVNGDRIDRKHVKILPRTTEESEKKPEATPKEDSSVVEEASKAMHSAGRYFSRSFQSLLIAPEEQRRLQQAYEKAFREQIDIPEVPLAFGLSVENPKSGGQPVADRHGSVLPLESKTERGYLMMTSYACTDDMGSLGISFHPVRTSTGTYSMELSKVVPGSPAALVGLKVGDRIEAYQGKDDSEMTGFGSYDYKSFLSSVKNTGAQKELKKRTFVLKGKTASGAEWQHSLTACPNYLDHKKAFNDMVDKAKKMQADAEAEEKARYCKENPGKIGIQYEVVPSNREGWWGIRVTSVTPDSPAARAGVKKGDYITTYGEAGTAQRWYLSSKDASHFLELIQKNAKGENPKLFVSGVSENGQGFERSFPYCAQP